MNRRDKFIVIGVLVAALSLVASGANGLLKKDTSVEENIYGLPVPNIDVPESEIAKFTERYKLGQKYTRRVFYRDAVNAPPEDSKGERSWGSFCLSQHGPLTADHVRQDRLPFRGPQLKTIKRLPATDVAFLEGFDLDVDYNLIPEIVEGEPLWIVGTVGRGEDTQIIRGIAHTKDNVPPGYWMLLKDGINGEGEGVIGGFSGSCVINKNGEVVGILVANGFSKLDAGDTWGRVILFKPAVREAQGLLEYEAPTSLVSLPQEGMPQIETGRHRLDY